MAVRSARTFSGDSLPDFPLGGRCKVVDVGTDWVDLLGAWESDLLLIRVPQGSKRVILLSTTDALTGTGATIDQSLVSWILDPGVWSFCVDRDRTTGPRFYLAIDPSDGSDDAATAALRVMEGATV